ncbi:MAG: ATP-grasp domain-containing protein, partial [Bacteroidota bacterium]
MNIHEYQAKNLLKENGVPVPEGIMIETSEHAVQAAETIAKKTGTDTWAVKAQIHAGGRGKGGGVKIAKSLDEVHQHANSILGMQLVTHQTGEEGKQVNKLLIEQGIYYKGESDPREFYMSVLMNRETGKNVIMYSTEGGVDIETVAEKTPHLIFKEQIEPNVGIQPFQARRIAFNLELSGDAFKSMVKFVIQLYNAYIATDASLVE